MTNSKICVARFPQFTLTVGDGASDPRVSGNDVRQCSPGKLTLEPGPRTVEFGDRLELHGLFLGQLPGARVSRSGARARDAEVRARSTPRTANTTAASASPCAHRSVQIVRLRSGSVHGPSLHVRVRPRVVLRRRGPSLVVKVRAGRSYAGRTVVLQVRRHGHWVGVQRVELRRHSRARFRPTVHGALVRITVAHTPGYLPAHSDSLRLP